ncbi:hypothetical protein L7F22_020771 [Adiantum nelumboides]|nr:hypothetical protein [Adiantum nelumboides]
MSSTKLGGSDMVTSLTIKDQRKEKIIEFSASNLELVWVPKSDPSLLFSSSKSGLDIASSSSCHSSNIYGDAPQLPIVIPPIVQTSIDKQLQVCSWKSTLPSLKLDKTPKKIRGPSSPLRRTSAAGHLVGAFLLNNAFFELDVASIIHSFGVMSLMKKSEPFHSQLMLLAGENSWAEPLVWLLSVSSGIIACKLIYSVMKASSPALFHAYSKLSKAEKIEWDNRAFSTCHAIVVSATAWYLLIFSGFFQDNGPYGPVVFRSSLLSQMMLGVSVGYFLSDLAMILWFYPALGGKEYVLHHLLSIISLALSLYSGQAHIYLYLVLLSEVTTPFVNLRWYLSMAGMKDSRVYVYNGILLFFAWLFARVLLFIYFFTHIYLHYDQVQQIFPLGFYFLFIAPPGLALMNIVWLYKILRGLLRMLHKRD